MNDYKLWIQALVVLSVLGCSSSDLARRDELQKMNSRSYVNADTGATEILSADQGCFDKKWKQPESRISNKIDMLFVTDTSASLNQKRQQIANAMSAFVTQLPKTLDLQVAVTLAHSPRSPYTAKLFQKYSEPAVLKSTELTLQQMKTYLGNKFTSPPMDTRADGGELGMRAITELLKPANLAQFRAKNQFFRTDAALVVIFVSDENDVCAVYPKGVKPVYDGDHLEDQANRLYCAGITAESVVKRIREVQGSMPSLIAAVVYNNLSTASRVGEAEYGYGFMDMVNLSNGISVDIAEANYTVGLAKIGQIANSQLTIYHDFVLADADIDPASIVVRVDGLTTGYSFRSELRSVYVENAGKPLSEVDVHYCLKGVIETPDPNKSPLPNSSGGPEASPSPDSGEDSWCGLPDCNIIGI